jgi:hypothetical protein
MALIKEVKSLEKENGRNPDRRKSLETFLSVKVLKRRLIRPWTKM